MRVARLTGLAFAGIVLGVVGGWADQKPPPSGGRGTDADGDAPPARWAAAQLALRLPDGDPKAGREVFAKSETLTFEWTR